VFHFNNPHNIHDMDIHICRVSNSAQPVNWSHLPIPHITNIHTAAEHSTIGSKKWLSDGDIMYSCGLIFMCGSFNGSVKQCNVKEQSIYRPTNAICDTPFVTYIYTATCFDTEVPSSGTHSNGI